MLFLLSILLACAAGDELQILTSHDNIGPPPCAKTCVGSTAELETPWQQHGNKFGDKIIKTIVDISPCGFIGTPTLLTSLHATSAAGEYDFIVALLSGQSGVANLSKNSFQVFLHGFHGKMHNYLPFGANFGAWWDVHWTAYGFVC